MLPLRKTTGAADVVLSLEGSSIQWRVHVLPHLHLVALGFGQLLDRFGAIILLAMLDRHFRCFGDRRLNIIETIFCSWFVLTDLVFEFDERTLAVFVNDLHLAHLQKFKVLLDAGRNLGLTRCDLFQIYLK